MRLMFHLNICDLLEYDASLFWFQFTWNAGSVQKSRRNVFTYACCIWYHRCFRDSGINDFTKRFVLMFLCFGRRCVRYKGLSFTCCQLAWILCMNRRSTWLCRTTMRECCPERMGFAMARKPAAQPFTSSCSHAYGKTSKLRIFSMTSVRNWYKCRCIVIVNTMNWMCCVRTSVSAKLQSSAAVHKRFYTQERGF